MEYKKDIISPKAGATQMPSVCKGCPNEHKCRDVWATPRQGPFSAGGIILASVAAFLLPIFFAILATALIRVYYTGAGIDVKVQILASLFGLAFGAGVAWMIMPLIRKHFREYNDK